MSKQVRFDLPRPSNHETSIFRSGASQAGNKNQEKPPKSAGKKRLRGSDYPSRSLNT